MALCALPDLANTGIFPSDAIDRANRVLNSTVGCTAGAYSDFPGVEIVRRDAADYCIKRDDGIPSKFENIIITAGATEGIFVRIKSFKIKLFVDIYT